MANNPLKVVAFAGSLRKQSLNRMLLQSAISLAPDGMVIEELDIHDIPLFNGDVESVGTPQSVTDFKESIAAADGLLIVTPEYNWGIPAVTKNLIDWASRRNTAPGNVLLNKPVSIMAIAGGTRGTGALVRSQVRDVIVFPSAIPMPSGDVGLSGGLSNFDDEGNLVNEVARTQVEQNLAAFADWIQRVSS
ncbi:MAG: NAD(P)H-dependent oxidoreductase [Chloroflexi bacterium]|nr:NAD(P)H-dependent oxidoreductase [Chloroflexota bacterium]